MTKLGERIKEIAVDLTKVQSIVGTKGEIDVAKRVYEILSQIEYFRNNPANLKLAPVRGDAIGRLNVIAVVEGQKGPSKKTVFTLGHIDTVGVDDYAGFKAEAINPDVLKEKLATLQLSEDAMRDLASDEWLFGRGLLDMKVGDAALMVMIDEYAGKVSEMQGNLIFAAVPDEEANSAGMLSAVQDISAMAAAKGWEIVAAIDTDATTPLYPGDENKYVYFGAVGKLLPCFYVWGNTSHVGEAFLGIDANMLASEILREINLNVDLCEAVEGEVTMPPISLQQRDLKNGYSVQTVPAVNLYFNYLTHVSDPDEVLAKCEKLAVNAFDTVIAKMDAEYQKYCTLADRPYHKIPWANKVWTYDQLYQKVKEQLGDKIDRIIAGLTEQAITAGLDDREFSLKVVEEVHKYCPDQSAKVILYLAPPYYPHVYVRGDSERDKVLIDAVDAAIRDVKTRYDYNIVARKFFPCLCDLSYCHLPRQESINKLRGNMPAWGQKYSLPVEAIKNIAVPVVNIGAVGKDFHQIGERLHVKYSLDAMPEILYQTIANLLK